MATCDVAVIGGGAGMVHAVDKLTKAGVNVTACIGNPFVEFSIASCVFVSDPTQHSAWVSSADELKVPGAEYVMDAVAELDPPTRTIRFASAPPLTYKAVIIATGGRLPLLCPPLGQSLAFRQAEVRHLVAARTSSPLPLQELICWELGIRARTSDSLVPVCHEA